MGTTTTVATATNEETAESQRERAESRRLWGIMRELLADIAMAKTLGAVTTAALMASLEMDGVKIQRVAANQRFAVGDK